MSAIDKIGLSLKRKRLLDLVSETLAMPEHPVRNRQRAGFQEVYDKQVYQWNA